MHNFLKTALFLWNKAIQEFGIIVRLKRKASLKLCIKICTICRNNTKARRARLDSEALMTHPGYECLPLRLSDSIISEIKGDG